MTKEQVEELTDFMKNMYAYLQITKDIVLPRDKVAYQAINNIISMSMISFGRKYGLDYFSDAEKSIDKDEEADIDDIMKEINKETEINE
jgi:hypothetical protein